MARYKITLEIETEAPAEELGSTEAWSINCHEWADQWPMTYDGASVEEM